VRKVAPPKRRANCVIAKKQKTVKTGQEKFNLKRDSFHLGSRLVSNVQLFQKPLKLFVVRLSKVSEQCSTIVDGNLQRHLKNFIIFYPNFLIKQGYIFN
jgi:hypothetical protein